MRLFATPWRRSALASFCVVLAGLLPAAAGFAQDAEPTPTEPIAIDLQRLLFEPDQRGVQDAVWRLEPAAGRRVVMLPLLVSPVGQATELSRSPIELRGGRFIGFFVPHAHSQAHVNPERVDFARFTDDSPEALGELLFGRATASDTGQIEIADSRQDQPIDGGADGVAPVDKGPEPPRLTREITLLSSGKIKWGLDRGLPSAELQSPSEQNLYPYKLDPQLIRDQEPERPERLDRRDGESSRDYAARRREQQTAYREEIEAFRELRDAIRELPDEFEQDAPAVVYALFEVREGEGLSLQGSPPMPWSLSDANHETLRQLAQARGGQLGEQQQQALGALGRMIDKGHPLDARAVALAVLRGQVAGAARDGGPGFELITKLLGAKDGVARRIALYAVVSAEPQSPVTARLIEAGGKQAQGREREVLKLAALRTLCAIHIADPDQSASLIAAVNKALADVDGPPADAVLNELLSAYRKATEGQFAGEGLPRVATTLVDGLEVSRVPDDQRDAAIARVIQHAPTNAVAAGWLDAKLLRNSDEAVVARALTLLNESRIAPSTESDSVSAPDEPRPGSDTGDEGFASSPPGESGDRDATDTQTDPAEADAGEPRIVLAGPIPIRSVEHGLIVALSSANDSNRALAWSALDRFRVEAARDTAGLPGAGGAGTQAMGKIVGLAMGVTQTPPAIVAFLDNHAGTELQPVADAALLRLLTEPGVDQAVAKRAAQRVVSSGRDLAPLLTGWEPAETFDVVAAFYKHMQGTIPPVVGLAYEPGGSLVSWFAAQLKDTKQLPSDRQWATQAGGDQAGGEAALLRLASSEDARLASAAAAALVLNAGGDETQQQRFAQTVAVMAERDQQAVQKAWAEIKTALYAKALGNAQGTYTMLIRVHKTERSFDPITGEALDPPAPTRIVLGVVQLKADGTSVSLSTDAVAVSVADDRLAIRIDSLSSLRSFAKPELADLPLSQLDQPLNLVPQDGGAWAGRTTLADGREMEVAFEPAE